ncbi:hypothetical protein [Sphingomonas sp. CFBP 8760]|uniref:hypothetical protein n=1 Tax=Sphingomonas sp. CFBP 8760 TaxID=2775282 RepID=UPI001782CA70|nr:hypothetical protein [Sphingomonas sp. CFBP 8760]MBD8548664.1 hypothetical protein [Sphingomonas sp. CFBP 8760]
MAALDAIATGLWPAYVDRVKEVIRAGLERLAGDAGDGSLATENENDLNRELFFRMRRVATERHRELLSLLPRPALSREHTWNLVAAYEANSQPSPDDPERTPRENKRPDFQWSFQDDQAVDLDRSTRTYVVECKRLGTAKGRWIFNGNYVAHGVRRYVDGTHLYGKDDIGGAMIGYVQSMDVSTISIEVGKALAGAELPPLSTPSLQPGSPVVHVAEHELKRLGAASPFTLGHFWVDLRKPT